MGHVNEAKNVNKDSPINNYKLEDQRCSHEDYCTYSQQKRKGHG